MRCSVKVEVFFVPFRLLAGSFRVLVHRQREEVRPCFSNGAITPIARKGFLPVIGGLSATNDATGYRRYDRRWRSSSTISVSRMVSRTFLTGRMLPGRVSAMPPLAYHRVYTTGTGTPLFSLRFSSLRRSLRPPMSRRRPPCSMPVVRPISSSMDGTGSNTGPELYVE